MDQNNNILKLDFKSILDRTDYMTDYLETVYKVFFDKEKFVSYTPDFQMYVIKLARDCFDKDISALTRFNNVSSDLSPRTIQLMGVIRTLDKMPDVLIKVAEYVKKLVNEKKSDRLLLNE